MDGEKFDKSLFLGIGFKVGILISFIGMLLMYMPLAYYGIAPYLDIIGFGFILNASPFWVKAATTGLILIGGAFYVKIMEEWITGHVDNLFFEDKVQKPK